MTILKKSLIALSLVVTSNLLQASCTQVQSLTQHDDIINNQCAVIVYSTPWCTACKDMEPSFDSVAKKNGNKATFAKANLDKPALKSLVKKLDIKAYPTTILYKNGKIIRKERGSLSQREIQQMADQATRQTQ
jgi:thiol-disulfide isomerase/thioredoxin